MNKNLISAMMVMALCIPATASITTNVSNEWTSAATDSSRIVDLDEVVVVSHPKEGVRLRQQPLASTVLTDRSLQRIGAKSLSGITGYVPSLMIPSYGSRITSSLLIRGIGSRSGASAVGVYYDHIPLVNKSAHNFHLMQMDRIDVLRGPQSTLYGINSEGGLIRTYSKNPLNYSGTDIKTSIGSRGTADVEVAHYHRPSDKMAFSAGVFYNGQRGFFDNDNLNKKADRSNELGGRMRFLLTPSSKWTIDLTADWQYTNQDAFPYGEYHYDNDSWDNPSTTFLNGYKRQMRITGINISRKTDSYKWTSTTSWQFVDDDMDMDQDYLAADYLRLEQRQKMNALTQELTLRWYNNPRWNHTWGLFGSHQWLHTDGPVSFGNDMNSMVATNISRALAAIGMPPAMANSIGISDNSVPGTFHTPESNIGIYHQSELALTSKLSATLGLRYDMQHISIDYDTYATFNLSMTARGNTIVRNYRSALQNSTSETYHQLLPKLALKYDIDNTGSNLYATVSKGYRSGGYNLQMFSDIFQTEQQQMGREMMGMMTGDLEKTHTDDDYNKVNNTISYRPEESWNYEIGTHLNLFGGAVHADASLFWMQVRNQQLSVMAGNYGYGRMMVNAGKTRSIGAEVAVSGQALSDHLTWAATYAYTRSTFENCGDSVRVPFVPLHSFSALIDYSIDTHAKCLKSITIGADIKGNGDIWWDAANTHKQDFYAVLGAHAMADFGSLKINLWARNLTDTKYNTFLVESKIDGTPRTFSQRSLPIQLGLDMTIHL